MLSCGKDNRTICWNPNAKRNQSEYYGDFPVVTNWTFQTRWSPHNPNLLATASFDGKISIQSIQNTGSMASPQSGDKAQVTDDEDFFDKAQSQPQAASFTLQKAPKWLERPCGASFGFGGKVVSFKTLRSQVDSKGEKAEVRHGSLHISTFVVDAGVGTSIKSFEDALKQNDLSGICQTRISEAKTGAEKANWEIIKTLTAENPRKALVDHLRFSNSEDETTNGKSQVDINGDQQTGPQANGSSAATSNRLSAFFENNAASDGFLSEVAATKGTQTNNPFQVYSGSESESERRITRALLLGQFEKALDICLQEDRLSDALMIAICGGQTCIEKAQKAYFSKNAAGPNYLRLLASVVGKNLWDIVYNASLENWKEVMATLCTYAEASEFPDLCEALGDRIEDRMKQGVDSVDARKDAAFCYLAGSKLEKVTAIWIAEMHEQEQRGAQLSDAGSSFSSHAQALQNFIEKVMVFREVTDFNDDSRLATADWKLTPLYDIYTEYADLVASQGQLQVAERYLGLLPDKYPAAEVAKSRIRQATKKVAAQPSTGQPATVAREVSRKQTNIPDFQPQQAPSQNRHQAPNPYAPAYPSQPPSAYPSAGNGPYATSGYLDQSGSQNGQVQQPQRQQPRMAPPPIYGSLAVNAGVGPPPRNLNSSPSVPPPSRATNMSNWNDLPEDFIKPPTTSRRGTPAAGGPAPMPYVSSSGLAYGGQQKSTPPLPPPPKGLAGPPRASSPNTYNSQPPERPSSAAKIYAPQQPLQTPSQPQRPHPVPRGTSPYNAPPSAPPPSNRYAPAPGAQAGQSETHLAHAISRQRPPPSNPYAPQQNHSVQQPQPTGASQTSDQAIQNPVGPPQGPPGGPPQGSRPSTAQSQRENVSASTTKYGKFRGSDIFIWCWLMRNQPRAIVATYQPTLSQYMRCSVLISSVLKLKLRHLSRHTSMMQKRD